MDDKDTLLQWHFFPPSVFTEGKKEIKQKVNWSVGWIAYRHKELSKIFCSSAGLRTRLIAQHKLDELHKEGKKILRGWM
jgi:hypothetical protein